MTDLETIRTLPDSASTAWWFLIAAGMLDVVCLVLAKFSGGFGRPSLAVWTGLAAWLSFVAVGFAVRSMPIGPAYAFATGIGVAGGALVGMMFFGDPCDARRLFCIALILVGIVGVKIIV
jgi:quaternary ammonium compound-resistance protein SugE